jgi:predicted component of type VI protein secretion system
MDIDILLSVCSITSIFTSSYVLGDPPVANIQNFLDNLKCAKMRSFRCSFDYRLVVLTTPSGLYVCRMVQTRMLA